MYLYKAIHYTEDQPLTMSSADPIIRDQYISWIDMVKTAYTHVSSGSKKKQPDCWLSTTTDLEIAKAYLNNKKYNFNGIALVQLEDNFQTGYIYDQDLREIGYIPCRNLQDSFHLDSQDNGITVALDLSSVFTYHYLSQLLWLKGEHHSLLNLRTYRYSHKAKEVLLFGRNIPFTYYRKEELDKIPLTQNINYDQQNYLSRIYFNLYASEKNLSLKNDPLGLLSLTASINEVFENAHISKRQLGKFYKHHPMTLKDIMGSFFEANIFARIGNEDCYTILQQTTNIFDTTADVLDAYRQFQNDYNNLLEEHEEAISFRDAFWAIQQTHGMLSLDPDLDRLNTLSNIPMEAFE